MVPELQAANVANRIICSLPEECELAIAPCAQHRLQERLYPIFSTLDDTLRVISKQPRQLSQFNFSGEQTLLLQYLSPCFTALYDVGKSKLSIRFKSRKELPPQPVPQGAIALSLTAYTIFVPDDNFSPYTGEVLYTDHYPKVEVFTYKIDPIPLDQQVSFGRDILDVHYGPSLTRAKRNPYLAVLAYYLLPDGSPSGLPVFGFLKAIPQKGANGIW